MRHHIATFARRLRDAGLAFGSAARAAAATDAGRAPDARDLRHLGIDADAFARIGRA